MTPRHSILIAAIALLAIPVTASADEAEARLSALEAQIDSLRTGGHFAEAVEPAREMLSLVRHDPDTPAYVVSDAELTVKVLEELAALPAEARAQLVAASGLRAGMDEALAAGDYETAEELGRQGVAILRDVLPEGHPDTGEAITRLAWVLHDEGNYAEAEERYREVLAIWRELLGDEHPAVAGGLNDLALLLQDRGEYAEAEPLYRRVLALDRIFLGERNLDVATSLNNYGLLLHLRGDYAAAEPLYRESLAIRREVLGEHWLVAQSLNNLAGLLKDRGDYEAAEPLYRESLAMYRTVLGDEHPDVARSLNNLATLLEDRGELEEAESLYRESLALRRQRLDDEHPDIGQSLNNLAHVLAASGALDEAEPLYRESLAIRRASVGRVHPLVVQSLSNLASVLRARGDAEGAAALLAEAADVYESARLRAGPGLARSTFVRSPYPAFAEARLATGDEEGAWVACERGLARTLADLLLAAKARSLSPAESAREEELRRELDDLEHRLRILHGRAADVDEADRLQQVDAIEKRLLEAELEWSTLQEELAERDPVPAGRPLPLAAVQRTLAATAACVGWLDVEVRPGAYESWGYVIRATGPVAWHRLPSGPLAPRDEVARLRASIGRDDPAGPTRSLARALWSRRIAPLADALDGVESLIVISSEAMLGFPVEVLSDEEDRYLGDVFRVTYAPSATILSWLAERSAARDEPRSALLVGDPVFRADSLPPDPGIASLGEIDGGSRFGDREAIERLPRLPGTRLEVEGVRDLFPGARVLLGPDATEQELARLASGGGLRQFDVVHIATHGIPDDERPEGSALILSQTGLPDPLAAALSGERIWDGVVTAGEVLREWDLDADLVTLSACESGLGRRVAGEGHVGLATAFLQAGGGSVLVSLWQVEDAATTLLMRRFYAGWVREGHPKAEALREAKRWLRSLTNAEADAEKQELGFASASPRGIGGTGVAMPASEEEHPYASPYYWAPFILIGDPR